MLIKKGFAIPAAMKKKVIFSIKMIYMLIIKHTVCYSVLFVWLSSAKIE